METETLIVCKKCGSEKTEKDYYRHTYQKGIQQPCKDCKNKNFREKFPGKYNMKEEVFYNPRKWAWYYRHGKK